MKTLKSVSALLLALIMVLSLAVPAMAAEQTYTLTINNESNGHTYEAYQIFSGTLAEKDGKQILSDVKWGTGINGDALLQAIAAEPKLNMLHGATNAESLANKLESVTVDSEYIDLFARIAGSHLVAVSAESKDVNDHYEITGLSAGYYLIKDKDNTLDGAESEAYTKYIVYVLKDQTVTPKSSVPSVDKSINDTLGGTYGEHEDFDISDTAYYKWVGTLPSNLKDYTTYTYTFKDELPQGIRYTKFEQVYIEGSDGNTVHVFYDVNDESTENDTMPAGMTATIEGNKVTLRIDNLLTLYPSILATHKVVVKYSAMVNRDALVVDAMTNSVYLEYSNNPYDAADFGKTPDDVAHAFTFKIDVDKYDADNSDIKLEGAEFKLYYERVENVDGTDTTVQHFAKVITEEFVYVTDEDGKVVEPKQLRPEEERKINGVAADGDDVGVIYGWTTNEKDASILDTDEYGKLTVKGLDSGIYYLKETKAPVGYNLMETPVMIEIIPTYSEDGDEVSVNYKVDSVSQSTSTVGVRNSSGSTLPSTGGMGTTLFYVFGSIMVLAAVILLVTKKRMSAEA